MSVIPSQPHTRRALAAFVAAGFLTIAAVGLALDGRGGRDEVRFGPVVTREDGSGGFGPGMPGPRGQGMPGGRGQNSTDQNGRGRNGSDQGGFGQGGYGPGGFGTPIMPGAPGGNGRTNGRTNGPGGGPDGFSTTTTTAAAAAN
ncbi:MAG: hypothetical protein U0Q22_10210 [Acidimicrobiales bacterium]